MFLVERRGKPGRPKAGVVSELNDRRSGQLVLGNAHRTITIAAGRVSEIAAAIRHALFAAPSETSESDEAVPAMFACRDEGS
jgi:hypothetical protein